jgi:hypothetical protein
LYHRERNHQGKEHRILFHADHVGSTQGKIEKKNRLGGMINYYCRAA